MKNLVILIAIISFGSILMTYQIDFDKMAQEKQRLKFAADEALASASLSIDLWEYANGYLIYDDTKVKNKVKEMMNKNFDKKIFTYKLIISDEKGTNRNYGEGKQDIIDNLSPYLLLKINIGKPNFRCIKCYEDIYVVSAYENQGF